MTKLADSIYREILKITTILIEIGLDVAVNFPSSKSIKKSYKQQDSSSKQCNITQIKPNISNETSNRIIFDADLEYKELYDKLDEEKNFNIKLIDGALITFVYEISEQPEEVFMHRLTFFPSPALFAYDYNEGEFDEGDASIYSDIISKDIYPFPIRFDYDYHNFSEITHPKSHLTLGQYKNCRIPVSSALSPRMFISFVLRNFYNSYYLKHKEQIESCGEDVNLRCDLMDSEKTITHVIVK